MNWPISSHTEVGETKWDPADVYLLSVLAGKHWNAGVQGDGPQSTLCSVASEERRQWVPACQVITSPSRPSE